MMNRPYDFRISTLDSRLLHQPVEESLEGDGVDAVGLGSNEDLVADEDGGRTVEIGAADLLHLVFDNSRGGRVVHTGTQRGQIKTQVELGCHR